MDLFDRIILEWGYRCKKGYPDINSEEDLNLFEKLFGINLMEELEANYLLLKFGELTKRGGPRLKVFYDRVKSNLPFFNSSGDKILLSFATEEYAELFKNKDIEGIRRVSNGRPNKFPFFIDSSGKAVTLDNLLKTPEFGGKGAGFGTVVEDENLYILKEKIKNLVELEGGPITVKLSGKEYEVAGAETQSGFPKSDFNLINKKGEPVIFISHKKSGGSGPSATDFIRWSGYTLYKDHPEVKKFNIALVNFLEENRLEGLPNKTRFISKIKDKNLIRELIYGPGYGGEKNEGNVSIIIQGEVELKKESNGKYSLSGEHTLIPPDIPKGDYYPYLTAGYRGDRKMFGIKNNEAIVMTKTSAFRASNVYELDGNNFKKVK